jgi:hypothetical protein
MRTYKKLFFKYIFKIQKQITLLKRKVINVILIQSFSLILPNNIVECFHLYPSIQTFHANQLNIPLIMTTP